MSAGKPRVHPSAGELWRSRLWDDVIVVVMPTTAADRVWCVAAPGTEVAAQFRRALLTRPAPFTPAGFERAFGYLGPGTQADHAKAWEAAHMTPPPRDRKRTPVTPSDTLDDLYPAERIDRVTTVTIRTPAGTVDVLAHPTATPGLVITPAVGGVGFTGGWSITHMQSGLAVPVDGGMELDSVQAAVRVADALGAIGNDTLGVAGIDWALSFEEVRTAVAGRLHEVSAAIERGLFPPATEQGGDPGAFPNTRDAATADRMARAITRRAERYDADATRLAGGREYELLQASIASAMHAAALAVVLRAYRRSDPAGADDAARQVYELWEDGATLTETVWALGREYGFPHQDSATP